MVKKLYKHEFLAWLRIMPIIYIIVLGFAGMHRFLQLFEADSIYYSIAFGSATFAFVLVIFAALAAPTVFGVIRFYKNLFSSEGYLSMTLPVTPANHLWVKLTTGVCFDIITILVVLFSLLIVTAGDMFTELCKAGVYLIKQIPEDVGIHLFFYLLEILLAMLLASFNGYLLYYTCLCIGHLFRRVRILASVGAFFAYNLLMELVSTFFSLGFTVLGSIGALDWTDAVIDKLGPYTIHLVFGIGLVISLLQGLIYFLVCHHILRKKLNLD